jgi:hypothetical protein
VAAVLVPAGPLALPPTDQLVVLEEDLERKTALTHRAALQIKELLQM